MVTRYTPCPATGKDCPCVTRCGAPEPATPTCSEYRALHTTIATAIRVQTEGHHAIVPHSALHAHLADTAARIALETLGMAAVQRGYARGGVLPPRADSDDMPAPFGAGCTYSISADQANHDGRDLLRTINDSYADQATQAAMVSGR